jgi:Putative  PD-(D/E)XK family member, (DUF4420)
VIDEIRLSFAALREAGLPAVGELAVRELSAGSGAFLAIDDEGRPRLLVGSEEPTLRPSGTAAIGVSRRVLSIGGMTAPFLDVTCLVSALSEIFDHLIVAVLDRMAHSSDAPSVVVAGVIDEWKRLLAATGPGPGRDRLAAMFGELLVLRDIVRADPARRVDAWVGPVGGRHDIRRGSSAIEVKTTRAHTARIVTVHGEDQLLEPEGGTLHLHLVRIEEVPGGGLGVPQMVDDIIGLGASPRDTFAAVEAAGLSPADYPMAAEVKFDVRERMTIMVDELCPRIVPGTFLEGHRPNGVVDVVYRIDLDDSAQRALAPDAYDRLIASIAGMTS